MHILVEMDGVLRGNNEAPIAPGIIMIGSLSSWNQITFMGSVTQAEMQYWLDVNKIVDFDRLIDSSVALEGEDLSERQVNVARAKGPIDLFITNNPKLWAYAFNMGIPSVMFAVPSYTRVEFRPDAPKRIRSWDAIEESINKQNELRTKDARLQRTEGLNFE
jgi:hypothetical protein